MTARYTLQQLSDLEQIRDLKTLYGLLGDDVCDTGQEGADRFAAAVFAEDAVGDYREGGAPDLLKGRAAIADFLAATTAPYAAWMWHLFTNPEITFVDADHAKGRWVVHALATPKARPQAAPLVTYGRYEEEYVRTPAGWLISALTYRNETREKHGNIDTILKSET
jgi:hypothetical protein